MIWVILILHDPIIDLSYYTQITNNIYVFYYEINNIVT